MSVEQSCQITELFAALLAFSADVEQPVKNARNEHFGNTFADLPTVLATVRPTLLKHGLVLTQLPCTTEKGIGLCTMVSHAASGQWIRATVAMPVAQSNPQAAASAITYARRYGVMSILGLAAEDDDGEAAMGRDTRIERKQITRDGSPIVEVTRSAPREHDPRQEPEQRMTRSAARAAVRRANAQAGGMRTIDDIANMARPQAPTPTPNNVSRLRSVRPNPSIPSATRPVANPRVVLGYNELANTIHAMTPVKISGELDQIGLLVPPGNPPRFASGENQGRDYTQVQLDVLRAMVASPAFFASAPPINKLWAAYLVARIDANIRAAQ